MSFFGVNVNPFSTPVGQKIGEVHISPYIRSYSLLEPSIFVGSSDNLIHYVNLR